VYREAAIVIDQQVSHKGIAWKHVPLPVKAGRNSKREELSAVVYGSIRRGRKDAGSRPLYSVGVKRTNGKLWVAFQEMPHEEKAQWAAERIAERLGGIQVLQMEMPRPKSVDKKVSWMLAGICVPLAIAFSWFPFGW